MVRPRKCRMVNAPPNVTYFKPRGVPLNQLNEIHLSVEGFEALRLVDHHRLKQSEAAVQMQVSRQTFGRMLSQARQTVSIALVDGMALRIRGGDYRLGKGRRDKVPPLRRLSMAERVESVSFGYIPENINKEAGMPKVAISCEGPSLDDSLDPRFGRAAGFILVDPSTLEFEYLDNGFSQTMAQGAGIQAAENVSGSGADVVLTGYVGPKAFKALQAAGIRIGQNLENMTALQALEKYKNGQVTWADAPNRGGHGR